MEYNHKSNILVQYLESIESVFSFMKDCGKGKYIDTLLECPTCHKVFRILN